MSENATFQNFEYDIFVPLFDNEGTPYGGDLLAKFKQRLVEKFGGLTDTKHKNEGRWKIGGIEQRDEIVIWRVLSAGEDAGPFMKDFKKQMERELRQDKILIICRQVMVL
jgi:hypothetical protein